MNRKEAICWKTSKFKCRIFFSNKKKSANLAVRVQSHTNNLCLDRFNLSLERGSVLNNNNSKPFFYNQIKNYGPMEWDEF